MRIMVVDVAISWLVCGSLSHPCSSTVPYSASSHSGWRAYDDDFVNGIVKGRVVDSTEDGALCHVVVADEDVDNVTEYVVATCLSTLLAKVFGESSPKAEPEGTAQP